MDNNSLFNRTTVVGLAAAILLLWSATATATNPGSPSESAQGWLGIVTADADPDDGVAIDTVLRRSPAHSAGLESGDRILSVNDQPVRTPGRLESILQRQPAGATVELVFSRSETPRDLEVRLEPSPSSSEVLQLHHEDFEAPELTVDRLEGGTAELDAADDRPLVIEFWATWCTVCRQVSRQIERADEQNPDAFDVIAVTRESPSTVEEHLQTHPMEHDIGIDAQERAHDTYLVTSYPFMVVVDSDGTVDSVVTDVGEIEELLDALVERASQ